MVVYGSKWEYGYQWVGDCKTVPKTLFRVHLSLSVMWAVKVWAGGYRPAMSAVLNSYTVKLKHGEKRIVLPSSHGSWSATPVSEIHHNTAGPPLRLSSSKQGRMYEAWDDMVSLYFTNETSDGRLLTFVSADLELLSFSVGISGRQAHAHNGIMADAEAVTLEEEGFEGP
jgi:hypothetical protein